ncbi:protein-disulfide reductase DsbD [soil metagenome]
MKYILLILITFFSTYVVADTSEQPSMVDKAFNLSVTANAKTLSFDWQIAPGYHLYRNHFSFKVESPATAQLSTINFPMGIPHHDEFMGDYQIYQNTVNLSIPYTNPTDKPLVLLVQYQGCSGAELCFPPIKKRITFTPSAANPNQPSIDIQNGDKPAKLATISTVVPATTPTLPPAHSDEATKLLASHNIFVICLGFFGFGLLLAFTPCVLPMIPILSGIIIGHGKNISTGKALLLSFIYVISMSLTYAIAGVIAGFAGNSLQASMQNPWVIGGFSALFAILALSLFGLFDIQMPHAIQQRVATMSHRQRSGSYIGVAVMGCLATLIVSPCVSAPLVAALAYMGQTGNALISGLALFIMGLGMGLPLLIIGTTSAKLLPKAGHWMYAIKMLSGVLLLATAIWMLQRVIPGPLSLFLWACLLIVCGMYMGAWSLSTNGTGWHKLWRGFGYVAFIYGAILIIGAAMGRSDPLAPLAGEFTTKQNSTIEQDFKQITSLDNLTATLTHPSHRVTLLDFYADWCISCKRMLHTTFAAPEVKSLLNKTQLLQADVTHNDESLKLLAHHFKVIGPPTLLFFNAEGKEMPEFRIVGEISADEFAKHLQEVLKQAGAETS